jgi:tRNA-splicing ligase RtcB
LKDVVTQMYNNVPTGVGAHRRDLRVSGKDLRGVLEQGAAWAVDKGLGRREDLDALEERGCIVGADPDLVSSARKSAARRSSARSAPATISPRSSTSPRSTGDFVRV